MGHLISLGGLDIPNLEFHEQQFSVRYLRHEGGGWGDPFERDPTQSPATSVTASYRSMRQQPTTASSSQTTAAQLTLRLPKRCARVASAWRRATRR
jgi:hypothetical protein